MKNQKLRVKKIGRRKKDEIEGKEEEEDKSQPF